ncbi:30S ribosomal protein S2 [bacterium]|nr:30S ribosomal protein S2 [bacterium]
MQKLNIQDLLEVGAHFGHQTKRWHPKMKPYIFAARRKIYIIDLTKTIEALEKVGKVVNDYASKGKKILFVCTKKQGAPIIKEEAQRCGMYYITARWLGGMLTNFQTVRSSVRRMSRLEKMRSDGTYDMLTKKEILSLEKQYAKLDNMFSGIREMKELPDLLYIVDIEQENIALEEAYKLNIPTIAIVDTDCNPEKVDFPIPANDDAMRSIRLITKFIADAILEGSSGGQIMSETFKAATSGEVADKLEEELDNKESEDEDEEKIKLEDDSDQDADVDDDELR